MDNYAALKKEIPDKKNAKAEAIKRRLAKGRPGDFNGPADGVHTKKTGKK